MYDNINKFEAVLEYIEANLTREIDCDVLAEQMTLSVYEFRRIFSFIVGCPLSDYIRKRKMSLAACELLTRPMISIQEISEKYGYSTQSSFSKAFSEYHGFSPSACQKGNCEIRMFSKPKFELRVQNGGEHSFYILNDTAFAIRGYSAVSELSDTCCCEKVWNDFYELGKDRELSGDKIFVSYRNGGNTVRCCIGERLSHAPKTAEFIPQCRWLCVKMSTTDDAVVNQKYNAVFCELLPSISLKRNLDMPTVEVYPFDMSEDGFEWEIRIPLE